MKKYIVVFLSVLLFSSCSDWLDVNPRQEMKQDDVFSTEEGYKSALNGVYIRLASSSLYGRDVSMLFPEFLAQTWITNNPSHENDQYIAKWDFTRGNVESLIESFWKSYYTSIVQLNDILDNIDGSETLFSNNNYEMIKGEALGLRAFLHLELLRFFGPIPGDDAANKAAIPYAETMTKDPGKLQTLSYREVTEKIIRDLEAAEKYLKVDPLITSTNAQLNNTNPFFTWETKPNDTWQMTRQVRFNYYAVKGVKARYYHWIGDKENAVKYAGEVIESEKFRLSNHNDLTGSADDYSANLVMLSEHLFGVHSSDHQNTIQSLFKDPNARLSQTDVKIKDAYEDNSGDIRCSGNNYWIKKTHINNIITYHFQKYTGNDYITPPNVIPVIRLVEMYFIMMEDLPVGDITAYWEKYALARNLGLNFGGPLTTADEVLKRLEKEYRKEFMGEGQMFFFYKKHHYTEYSWPVRFVVPAGYQNYEIPRPKSQIVFD